MDKICVIDMGSQYTHLIVRRIRELGVYSEVLPYDVSIGELKKVDPKGIILSGGPSSVYEEDSPQL
ncbi:MAG: glutamine amidotransferase-related protein, partial [Promethearchaeota archaeon]